MKRRSFLKTITAGGAGFIISNSLTRSAAFGQTTTQIPIPGSSIPRFVHELPSLHTILAGSAQIQLNMSEFLTNVLPPGWPQTWTWGYLEDGQSTIPSYIGPVIVATRGTPTEIKYVNNLGDTDETQLLMYLNSTDQTLHWADPLNPENNLCAMDLVLGQAPANGCGEHYSGPIPAVPHLHGGEVPPVLDGGPDSWFTSDGNHHGHAYYSKMGGLPNEAIYRYPNSQEAAPIWFHDHTLGATRINVFAGLAGAYLIVDPNQNLPSNLPGPGDIVPLVIQDRTFDTQGQFFLPAGPGYSPNPEHPFWVPEFVGDTILVNGKVWPFKNVQRRRYRFLFLNGSNARTYELFLADPVTKVAGPPMWVIGTDGGYLDAPVKIDPNAPKPAPTKLTIMPGERYDVIIDFGDPAWLAGNPNFSGTLIMRNTGRTPYPKGESPNGLTVGEVLKFVVIGGAVADGSYNPASGAPLRSSPMVRLVSAGAPTVAAGVTVNKVRQLTLNEVIAPPSTVNGIAYPGGPLEILVNNTKWSADDSEVPVEGDTEVWEIVNLTADAHPIHLHLVQFQILSRQNFNVSRYTAAYNAAFPAGTYTPASGPPLDYSTGNARALGGNPDITPYLQGPAMPAASYESGWKDTAIMHPAQVTRIVVRFAPTDVTAGTRGAYPFNPDGGHGYVWHCHIIDHEDNEMMRPYSVTADEDAPRTYVLGTDY